MLLWDRHPETNTKSISSLPSCSLQLSFMAGIWSGRKRVNVDVRESYGLARNEGFLSCSLRSKAFPFGFGTKKDRGTGFSVLAAREMKQEPNNESRGRERGRKVSFLSSPPPPCSFTCAIFRAFFDSRSSFFASEPHGNACYAGDLSCVRVA